LESPIKFLIRIMDAWLKTKFLISTVSFIVNWTEYDRT
jgi:hypothetical protein